MDLLWDLSLIVELDLIQVFYLIQKKCLLLISFGLEEIFITLWQILAQYCRKQIVSYQPILLQVRQIELI